jgi:hypothetical protein
MEKEQFTGDSSEPENDEETYEEEEKATADQESENAGEAENQADSHQCPACGVEVDIGSSICVVCGNTLS